MNDVLAFIEKAMERKLDIKADMLSDNINILISSDKNRVSIWFEEENKNLYIDFRNTNTNAICIEDLPIEDILNFKVLFLKAMQYSDNKTEEMFHSFFNDENKPLNINDLDNDDE